MSAAKCANMKEGRQSNNNSIGGSYATPSVSAAGETRRAFVGRDNRVLLMPLSIQNALSEEITADMVIRFSDETLQVF